MTHVSKVFGTGHRIWWTAHLEEPLVSSPLQSSVWSPAMTLLQLPPEAWGYEQPLDALETIKQVPSFVLSFCTQ